MWSCYIFLIFHLSGADGPITKACWDSHPGKARCKAGTVRKPLTIACIRKVLAEHPTGLLDVQLSQDQNPLDPCACAKHSVGQDAAETSKHSIEASRAPIFEGIPTRKEWCVMSKSGGLHATMFRINGPCFMVPSVWLSYRVTLVVRRSLAEIGSF